MTSRKWAVGAAAGLALVTLAACSSSGSKSGGSTGSTSGGKKLSGACAPYSAYAGHKGTVTMFGSILSPESDSLAKSWAQFEKCTGITIKYTGSNTFESDLPVKVNGGNAPDLAIIPQPGLLTQMVADRQGEEAAGTDRRQRERLEPGLEELRLGRRGLLRSAHEREHEDARVVLAEVLQRAQVHGPDHVERTSSRCRTRSSPTTTAPSRGAAASTPVRRAAGRRPTGSRRPCSAPTAARSTTTGSAHKVKFNSPQILTAMADGQELHAEPELRERRLRRRRHPSPPPRSRTRACRS